jgi:archaellum component FlaC
VNIGIEDRPIFVNIGDYWSNETIKNIVDLMHEYQDLFPSMFSKMKGITKELGEMKILLNPYVKTVKQRRYKMNP